MAPRNWLVDEHNMAALDLLPGERLAVLSETTVSPHGAHDLDSDISDTLVPVFSYDYTPTGVPPHKLHLMIDAPVLVIRNILYPMSVSGKLFLVEGVDQYSMLVARYDAEVRVVGTEVFHRVNFAFCYADIPMIRR